MSYPLPYVTLCLLSPPANFPTANENTIAHHTTKAIIITTTLNTHLVAKKESFMTLLDLYQYCFWV